MLFFLTGNPQTGKTRWLLRQVDELSQAGVECCGVVAPGTWIERDGTFEKTGIDNLLLPERRTVPFARRRDLAQAEAMFDENSQAGRAGLLWAISDAAIDQVNAHLKRLSAPIAPAGAGAADRNRKPPDPSAPPNRLLVIDEFGILELERGQGLTEGVALIDRGATPDFPHALVVVRAQLVSAAERRFSHAAWNGMKRLSPTSDGSQALFQAFPLP